MISITKYFLVLFLLLGNCANVHAQVTINPGESYTPEQVICAACPPERLPEVKIVDPSGAGDYTSVKDAAAASQPGWIILVKNGTYNQRVQFQTSGTSAEPIVVRPYGNHKPVFDFTGSADQLDRIEINADYIVFEGFEVTKGYEGIKITNGDNVVIRNNYIHHNDGSGIINVFGKNNMFEHNRIESNGVASGCMRHCHGIYLSNYQCTEAPNNNIIRDNRIWGHGGAAIQFNNYNDDTSTACVEAITANLIEYNQLLENAVGINFYHSVDGNTVKDNTFRVTHSISAQTNESTPSLWQIWDSENNDINNNLFFSDKSSIHALEVYDTASANNNVSDNMWMIERNWWLWNGSWRSDWLGYQQVAGWDVYGYVGTPVNGW